MRNLRRGPHGGRRNPHGGRRLPRGRHPPPRWGPRAPSENESDDGGKKKEREPDPAATGGGVELRGAADRKGRKSASDGDRAPRYRAAPAHRRGSYPRGGAPPAGGIVPFMAFAISMKGVNRSIGTGKMVVELFSAATSRSVCR